LTVGIRPEDLVPAYEAPFEVQLNAEMTEQLGGASYIYATSRHGERVAIKHKGVSSIRAGERLAYTFSPDKVRLFNEVGARLR
jgi:ABC-type sugar transport system ATPase subunit